MNDKELIKKIAEIWVENGGDVEGIDWNIKKIKEEIKNLIENK